MRVFLKERSPGQIEFGIIYGGVALLALFAVHFLPVLRFLPSCAFKGFTGMPCPTCGSTRSVVHLAHGELSASVAANPLISFCFCAAVLYCLFSIITLSMRVPRPGIVLSEREKNLLRAGAVMIVLINWIYLILTRC